MKLPISLRFQEMANEIFDKPLTLKLEFDTEKKQTTVSMTGFHGAMRMFVRQTYSDLILAQPEQDVYDCIKQDFKAALEIAF